ncbi:MAG: GAF domain-containing protein, partial [Anaerolineae bacterium]|nr:GAF domain-containing protein [Anaerolineae bacterium]
MSSPEDLMRDLNNPQKRIAALLALWEAKYSPALDRILSFAHDSDPQLRRAVMTALASFQGDRVMAAIVGGLHDSDEGVRAAASAAWAKWVLKNVLQLTGGERGYVVLRNAETGAMEFGAGAGVDAEQITGPQFATSRTVIEEVARNGESILTDNASMDSRYQSAESIVGFSLRQLIAVPLKDGDDVLGVVYCDKRFASGLFKADDVQTLSDFMGQAVAMTQQPLPMAEQPEDVQALDDLLGDDMI